MTPPIAFVCHPDRGWTPSPPRVFYCYEKATKKFATNYYKNSGADIRCPKFYFLPLLSSPAYAGELSNGVKIVELNIDALNLVYRQAI